MNERLPLHLALTRAQARLIAHMAELEPRLDAGADDSVWRSYCECSAALAAIAPHSTPESRGQLLTTKEMADRLNVSSKTLLRRRARGQVEAAVQLGKRGRAALRWA